MDSVVIGAGIIGITTAFSLYQHGHRVTVIDKQAGPGQGASFANGGQLSATYCCQSLLKTSTIEELLASVVNPRSPLVLRPTRQPEQWRWLSKLSTHCQQHSSKARSAKILLRLFAENQALLHQWAAIANIDYAARRHGVLALYRDKRRFLADEASYQLLKERSVPYRILSPQECIHQEPTLRATMKSLYVGLYTPQDHTGDAHLFVEQLSRFLAQRGVVFFWHTRLQQLVIQKNQVQALQVMRHEEAWSMKADCVVLCTGKDTNDFIAEESTLYPVRGYSVTIFPKKNTRLPKLGLIDIEKKVVITPLDRRLRVAGLVDIGNKEDDCILAPDRIRTLLDCVQEVLPHVTFSEKQVQSWCGARPLTADGIPLIGKYLCHNLYLNTGHGFWGWTTCCASAYVVSQMIDRIETIPYASSLETLSRTLCRHYSIE